MNWMFQWCFQRGNNYHVYVFKGMYTAHYIAYTYCCFLHSACLSTVTDHKPHAKVCTYPYQCSYLMLNVGNVHVTVRNYELWGQRSSFRACSNSRGVLLQAKRAHRHCFATMLPVESCRGQGVTAQHWNGMFLPGSRSSLQRGPKIIWDHRHTPSFLLPTSLHFHLLLPALLLYKLMLVSQLHVYIMIK